MSADQQNCIDYVGQTSFSCNVATHLATKGSSFVEAYRVDTNLVFKRVHSTLEFNEDGENLAKKQSKSCR